MTTNEYEMRNVLAYVKNVGLYLRKSRGDLDKDLEKHRSHMIKICEDNGWNYLEYKEIGTGDSIEARTEIKYLLKDIESQMFDAVIVFDYDRLGRGNATDQDTISRIFRRSNTLIITAYPFTVLDPNDERDEETMEFKGFLARREYKMITKRLSGGKKFGLRLGRWSNGVAPYGYEYEPEIKSLIVNEEQAKVYKELMKEPFLNGDSSYDIAWNLNKKGILSPRNGKWHPETIRNLLMSEVHMGWIVSNKTEGVRDSQNHSGDKKQYKKKPKEEWIIVKNCHPRLKTEEEHERIKKELKKRARHNNGNSVNPLSGLVKCSSCNTTMTMQKVDDGRIMIKKCRECGDNKGGDSQLALYAIERQLKKIKDILKDKQLKLKQDDKTESLLQRITELEEEIDVNESAIERIEEAFEDGVYDSEKMQKKRKVRLDKISVLEDELREQKGRLERFSTVTNEERVIMIEKFFNDIEHVEDGESINKLYKSLIDSIIWKRSNMDEVKVTVNFL